jgi:RarD protein
LAALVGDFLCTTTELSAASWSIVDHDYLSVQLRNIISGRLSYWSELVYFILSIQVKKAIKACWGHFIFPFLMVAIGWIGFGEGLSRQQNIATVLTAAAVLIMMVSKAFVPWMALVIAISFSLYGYAKKTILTGPGSLRHR